MTAKYTVLILGPVASLPVAGVAWQALHYIEGFRRLGHDVFYLEQTGIWPYHGCDDLTRYLSAMMEGVSLGDNWAYVCPVHAVPHGSNEAQIRNFIARSDILVNVTGTHILTEDLMRIPRRVYLETDPVLPQFQVALGDEQTMSILDAHTHYLTFGEKLGDADCLIPVGPYAYRPTRQPIVVDWWATREARVASTTFTTITSWEQQGKDIEWLGETYRWSKHREWERFIELPLSAPAPLELALSTQEQSVVDRLNSYGWLVADGLAMSRDLDSYRSYIQSSAAEFTVAKEQYTRTNSGWFSDRTATYLAAGKPTVTQATGFEDILPTGRGLFAFETIDDVLVAMDAILSDHPGHSAAAREIAMEYFDVSVVIPRLLQDVGM